MILFSELVCDLAPARMRQRVAVQQEKRRSLAAVPQMNACPIHIDIGAREALEHAEYSQVV
jgi:hypothetical protein